ncbi:MAG: hypothetical protein WCK10_03175 [Candidatus Staskawiczbacteria bacterium]
MSKKILLLTLLSFLGLPSIIPASAQLYRPPSPYSLNTLGSSIETAIWVVFTCIVVVCFVVAGILFLTAMGDAEKVKTARSAFIWGVVGIVVGIVAYSAVRIITGLMR